MVPSVLLIILIMDWLESTDSHCAYVVFVQKFDYGYTRKLFNEWNSNLYISHSTWFDLVMS